MKGIFVLGLHLLSVIVWGVTLITTLKTGFAKTSLIWYIIVNSRSNLYNRTMDTIKHHDKDISTNLRSEAVRLRCEERLSYSAIKKRLGVAKSTLSYWLKEYHLSDSELLTLRRNGWSKGEASREKYRRTMRLIKSEKEQKVYNKYIKSLSRLSDKALFIAGLMLYSAEGDKKNHTRIVIANTDIDIILFFTNWAIKYLGIKKEVIKIQLHLYEDMDIEEEKKYWVDGLKMDARQLYKVQIRVSQKSSFTYSESYRHGTCSLYILSVEKKMEVMAAIKAFFDLYKGV